MFPNVSCTITGMEQQDWKRLGDLVVQRRIALGMRTREALAEAADLSSRLLADVEKGRRDSYSPGTMLILERVLKWTAGSVRDVLAGGEPQELPSADEVVEMRLRATSRPVPEPAVPHVGVPLSMIALVSEAIDDVAERVAELGDAVEDFDPLRRSVAHAQRASSRLLTRAVRTKRFESTITEGEEDGTNITQQRTSTPSTVDRSAGSGEEGRTPPMNAAPAATEDKPRALMDGDQGADVDYELAARKGETEDEIRERLGISYE